MLILDAMMFIYALVYRPLWQVFVSCGTVQNRVFSLLLFLIMLMVKRKKKLYLKYLRIISTYNENTWALETLLLNQITGHHQKRLVREINNC